MSLSSNIPSTGPRPFSLYLNDAAKADPHGRLLIPSHRGNTMLRTAAGHLHSVLTSGWRWLEQSRTSRSAARRLRVTETVSVGDKRFVSIVQVDDTQFLIGSSANGVQMLAQLQSKSAVAAPATITTQEMA